MNVHDKGALMMGLREKELAQSIAQELQPSIREQIIKILEEFQEDDKLFTLEEAAEYIKIGRTTLSKLISKGDIAFTSFNPENPKAEKRVLKSDIDAWMKRNRTEAINHLKDKGNGTS